MSFSTRWLSSQTEVVLASYRGGVDGNYQGLGRAKRVRSTLEIQGRKD